jgi:hypothetical protein
MVLFCLKSDWESNNKKVEDLFSFPTGIYLPSSDQRFRRYSFLPDDGVAENCNTGQIAVLRENKFWGCSDWILPLSWTPKSWTTLRAFHWLLVHPYRTNGLEVIEFCASVKLLKSVLHSTTVGGNKILTTRLIWNSRISEYQSIS